MRQRYLRIGMFVVALALMIVLVVQAIPSQSDRLVQRAAQALSEGRIDEADHTLAELADLTRDSIDLTSIMSIRLGLSAARIARDNQISLEYHTLSLAYPEEHELHQMYSAWSKARRDNVRQLTDDMMKQARTYREQHYQSGLRLKSPLRGTLYLPADDPDFDAAYLDLLEGKNAPENRDVLERSIAREVAGIVLGLIVVQDEGAMAPDRVALSGDLDLAELWWLVGANSTSPLFTEWCFNRVVEETDKQPDHPARQRALDALTKLGR